MPRLTVALLVIAVVSCGAGIAGAVNGLSDLRTQVESSSVEGAEKVIERRPFSVDDVVNETIRAIVTEFQKLDEEKTHWSTVEKRATVLTRIATLLGSGFVMYDKLEPREKEVVQQIVGQIMKEAGVRPKEPM